MPWTLRVVSDSPAALISIADCTICREQPQRQSFDSERCQPTDVAPHTRGLACVFSIEDTGLERNASSVTRLLRCPACGTHYYWNHYINEGEYFMDPTSDVVTTRRMDAVSALDLLRRVLEGGPGALPPASGQLIKAFCEGRDASASEMAKEGLDQSLAAAARDRAELSLRREPLMRSLVELLAREHLDPQLRIHALESLLFHYADTSDWRTLRGVLLEHRDRVVRIAVACLLVGVGTNDAAPVTLTVIPRRVRDCIEEEVARPGVIGELSGIFLEAINSGDATMPVYDHGFGVSKYYDERVRSIALYELSITAMHGADLKSAIPRLMDLLDGDDKLTYAVTRPLEKLAERLPTAARVILERFAAMDASQRDQLLGYKPFAELITLCRKRAARTGRKPKT